MKNKKIALVICVILFIYFVGGIVYSFIDKSSDKENKKVDNGITIKGYDYILYENDPKIYADEFNKLKV